MVELLQMYKVYASPFFIYFIVASVCHPKAIKSIFTFSSIVVDPARRVRYRHCRHIGDCLSDAVPEDCLGEAIEKLYPLILVESPSGNSSPSGFEDGRGLLNTISNMTTYSGFTDSGRQLFTGVDINEVYKRIPAGSKLTSGAKLHEGVVVQWKATYKCMDGTKITVTMDGQGEAV